MLKLKTLLSLSAMTLGIVTLAPCQMAFAAASSNVSQEVQSLQNSQKSLEKNRAEHARINNRLQTKKSALAKSRKTAKKSVIRIRENAILKIEAQLRDLNAKAEILNAQITDLKHLATQKARQAELETKAAAELQALRERQKALEEKMADRRNTETDLNSQIEARKIILKQLMENNDDVRNANTKLSDRLSGLSAELSSTTQKVNSLENLNNDVRTDYANIRIQAHAILKFLTQAGVPSSSNQKAHSALSKLRAANAFASGKKPLMIEDAKRPLLLRDATSEEKAAMERDRLEASALRGILQEGNSSQAAARAGEIASLVPGQAAPRLNRSGSLSDVTTAPAKPALRRANRAPALLGVDVAALKTLPVCKRVAPGIGDPSVRLTGAERTAVPAKHKKNATALSSLRNAVLQVVGNDSALKRPTNENLTKLQNAVKMMGDNLANVGVSMRIDMTGRGYFARACQTKPEPAARSKSAKTLTRAATEKHLSAKAKPHASPLTRSSSARVRSH